MHDNLTHVALDTTTDTDNFALLASNIHNLRQLVSFRCKHHRIHQVVHKAGFGLLRALTDDSVQHLLQLKNLRDLNVQIDVHFFWFVCVANITSEQNCKQSLGNKNWWYRRENFNAASADGNPFHRVYSDYRYSNTKVSKYIQSGTILSSRWPEVSLPC